MTVSQRNHNLHLSEDRAKILDDLMELNQFRDIYNDVTWTGANNKCKTTFYIPNM